VQVYNLTTYPHLVGLLEALGVDTEPSDMSFALSSDDGAFEWGSRSLAALFCQRRNLISPTFWRMVVDVVRFGRGAREVTACHTVLNSLPSAPQQGWDR
jgi:predicted NAD/FAD-binding protein